MQKRYLTLSNESEMEWGGDNVLKDCLNIQWSLDQVTLIDLKL